MASKALDGARLKVVRAKGHLDSFKEEVGRYLESDPYEFPPPKIEDGKKLILPHAVVRTQPDVSISCILGDCVGNLRAALDYVAWQLAIKYTNRPLNAREELLVSFPICAAPGDWPNSNRAAHLSGTCCVPTPAMDEIEKVQPYHAGYRAVDFLNRLAKMDKHRLPLLTVGSVDKSHPQITLPGNAGWILSGSPGAHATFSAGVPGYTGSGAGDVKVEGQATVFVTLQDASMPQGPIDLLLGEMVKCVSDIIPRFDPFV